MQYLNYKEQVSYVLYMMETQWCTRRAYQVGLTMSMLTLFESRYTLKGRYNIGNVG